MNRRSLLLAGLQTAVLTPSFAQQKEESRPQTAALSADSNHRVAFDSLRRSRTNFAANVVADNPPVAPPPEIAAGRAPLIGGNADINETWNDTQMLFLKNYGPTQYAVVSPIAIDPPRAPDHKWTSEEYYNLDCKLLGTSSLLALHDAEHSIQQFLYNHVDVLLNQSSEILDRALSEYMSFADYSAKAASLALEVNNFFANDRIHKDEISAGIYTVPYELSLAEEQALAAKLKYAKDYADELWSDWALRIPVDDALTGSQILATLPYCQIRTTPLGNYVPITVSTKTGNVTDNALNLAMRGVRDTVGRNLLIEENKTNADVGLARGVQDETAARLTGATAKREWDYADIDFQRRRTEEARKNAQEKVRLSVTPGGAFNYSDQAKASRDRFVRDLYDAMGRLKACKDGLKVIFGYDTPFPKSLSARNNDVFLVDILNDCIKWTRDSVRYLSAFGLLDQGYTLGISVKQLLGLQAWQEGLASGEWTFLMGDNLVPKQSVVRLTGVNIFVRPSAGMWTGSLQAPSESYYMRLSGEKEIVDQSNVPPVLFGRIGSRNVERYREIYGTMLLRNIAPMGKWAIKISPLSTYGEQISSIEDIEIDFDLMIQARRGQ